MQFVSKSVKLVQTTLKSQFKNILVRQYNATAITSQAQKMNQINNHFKYNFAIATQQDYDVLQKICQILGTKYLKCNEQIEFYGQVRLIDKDQKLIGVYDIDEARKKCQQMDLDIVLVNDKVKPAICKAIDQKENLYKRFINDVLKKDYELKDSSKQQAKIIKLSSNILFQDLQNKAKQAIELGKKSHNVRMQMDVLESEVNEGKNVILTFKDMIKEQLITLDEISQTAIEKRAETYDDKPQQTQYDYRLELEFQSIKFQKQQAKGIQKETISEADIRNLINQFLKKQTGMLDEQTQQEILKDSEESSGLGYREFTQEKSLAQDLNEYQHDSVTSEQQMREEIEYYLNQKQDFDPQLFEEALQSISQRHNKDRDVAMFEYLNYQQQEKLKLYKRLIKMIQYKYGKNYLK